VGATGFEPVTLPTFSRDALNNVEPVFTFRKQYVDDEGHSIKKALFL